MKRMFSLLTLLLALSLLAGCAGASMKAAPTGTETPVFTDAPSVSGPEASAHAMIIPDPTATPLPAPEGEYLEDFSVTTVDGSVFNLYEALEDHELVMINLFATWCGPCAMEFPYLQEAWSECSDRVAVIALSIEPTDSLEVLRQYAQGYDLRFPMGREEGTDLERFVPGSIPTSLLVDHSGRVAAVETGAKLSAQEFLDWFDDYSGENYDPSVCTYTVQAYLSHNYEALPGVVINFCTDTSCTPVTTDETGLAVFTGPPARYHVQIIKVPDGCRLSDGGEWTTELYAQTFWIPIAAA